MKKLLPSLLLLCLCLNSWSQNPLKIKPSDTDPAITSNNDFHFIYAPTGTAQNKLLVFFPGTGAIPQFYQTFMEYAAQHGYHVIGLTYPNDQTINSFCASVVDSTCHRRARMEVIYGSDLHSSIQVNEANSILNRLKKALSYLDVTYPNALWAQFLQNDSLQWQKMALSGHSQGAGMAGIMAKLFPVDRALLFAALDWVGPLNRPADWVSMPSATPSNQFFAFIHRQDELIDFGLVNKSWLAYKTNIIGGVLNVDSVSAPYSKSRCLYSTRVPAFDSSAYHNATVVSLYTPKNSAQMPVYIPVWNYMLSEKSALVGLNESSSTQGIIYPNPASNKLYISSIQIVKYCVFDQLGKEVLKGNAAELDISQLANGVYTLEINELNKALSRHRFIKE